MKKRKLLFGAAVLMFVFALALTSFAVKKPVWSVKEMVRTEFNPGIRFCAQIDASLREDEALEEYGFIVTSRTKLKNEGVSIADFSHESNFYFGQSVNYKKDGDVDAYLENDGEMITFSAILVNIPEEHYNSGVVAKAYIKYGGEYYYSPAFSITYLAAANSVKRSEGYDSFDNEEKNVIENIISVGEKLNTMRIVSFYDVAADENGKWRIYYSLYNPYTGERDIRLRKAVSNVWY